MAHYFTNENNLKEDLHTFKFRYHDHELTFTSDSGVFSKQFVDYGSRVLLEWIDLNQAQSLLDVGCGYGAIGLSLAKNKPSCHFTLVDVNKKALELCKQNAKVNKIDNVDIFESDVYANVNKKYDVVVSNPPIRAGKEVVTRILVDSYEHLNDHGTFYCVIQKKQGAPSAKKNLKAKFGNCEIVARDKGYYILKSVKK